MFFADLETFLSTRLRLSFMFRFFLPSLSTKDYAIECGFVEQVLSVFLKLYMRFSFLFNENVSFAALQILVLPPLGMEVFFIVHPVMQGFSSFFSR